MEPKSMKNRFKISVGFWSGSWIVFAQFWGRFGQAGPSKMELSCGRGAIFQKITFFRPDAVLDRFLIDFGAVLAPFWDQNRIKKSINKNCPILDRFWKDFGSQIDSMLGPFGAQNATGMPPRRPKTAQKGPKTAQEGPQRAPKGPQEDRSFRFRAGPGLIAQISAIFGPRRPKSAPKSLKEPPRRPKTAPRAPKILPRRRRKGPGGPQDGPRALKEGPIWLQDGPRGPQDAPKGSQGDPQEAKIVPFPFVKRTFSAY